MIKMENNIDTIIEKYSGIIKNNILFSGCSSAETKERFKRLHADFKTYKKDAFLHRSGETLKKFGLVIFGRIKVLIDDIEGNTTIMAEVTPGKTFGESICFLGLENTDIYICSVEESGVIWLSADALFSDNGFAAEKAFVRMLATRTLDMNERIQILSKLTLREKIVTYFTFLVQKSAGNTVNISLSREEMALYMGTNRSALSRELSNMKKEGLIDFYKNRFVIKF